MLKSFSEIVNQLNYFKLKFDQFYKIRFKGKKICLKNIKNRQNVANFGQNIAKFGQNLEFMT